MKRLIPILILVLLASPIIAQDASMYVQLSASNGSVIVDDVGLVAGTGANLGFDGPEYFAVLRTMSGKIATLNFSFPAMLYVDQIDGTPLTYELAQPSQLLYFPYSRDVDRLEVYSSGRRLALSYDLSEYRVCDFNGRCSANENINTCPEDCRVKVQPTEELKQEVITKLSDEEPIHATEKPKGFYILIISIILLALAAFMLVKFSRKNKGQVTLFIILGIVIVFAIGIGLYFSGVISNLQKQQESVEAEKALAQSRDAQSYVEACMADSLKYVIPVVLRNGGYYTHPEKKVMYLHYDVPIYMDEGKEYLPTKETMEREMASGVDSTLPGCLAGIGEDVKIAGTPESEVTITNGKIIAETKLPLTLQGDVSSKLVGFYADYEANIMPVYQESMALYKEVKGIKGIVQISKLAFLASKKDYEFFSDSVGETQLYILKFSNYRLDNRPLEYSFAVNNSLKKGEHIVAEGVDYSVMFGLVPEESS